MEDKKATEFTDKMKRSSMRGSTIQESYGSNEANQGQL